MKKVLLCTVILCSLTVFAGCEEKGEISQPIDNGNVINASEEVNQSKTIKLMSGDYYMKYSMQTPDGEVETEISRKGEKTATNVSVMGKSIEVVTDGNVTYTIADDQKMMTKTTMTDGPSAEQNAFAVDEQDTYTTGEEVVDGVEYSYEEFEKCKFYYLSNDLKMIKSDDNIIKVLACENKSKDDMFNILGDNKITEKDISEEVTYTYKSGDVYITEKKDNSNNFPSAYTLESDGTYVTENYKITTEKID